MLSHSYVCNFRLLARAFPGSLENELRQLLKADDLKIWTEPIKVCINNEDLSIPRRLLAKPFDISNASVTQQTIYHCLYSRSTDGHVREASVRALLNLPDQDWATPYLFLALSDYVIQVANIVANKPGLKDRLATFAHENPNLYSVSLAQALSYWDLNKSYGIAQADYHNYPPYKMLASLNAMALPWT